MHGPQEDDNEASWNVTWQKYLNGSEEEQYKLLQALARTRVVWLIHRSGYH